MELKMTTDGNTSKVTFIPETEEESRIMGSLRNHYFGGLPEEGTYPAYDGITTENNFVTSMTFKYKHFE